MCWLDCVILVAEHAPAGVLEAKRPSLDFVRGDMLGCDTKAQVFRTGFMSHITCSL
jgi:hypothetical protein